MLLSRTKENIKIHHKLVTGVMSPALFLVSDFQGIHWFACMCITDKHAKEKILSKVADLIFNLKIQTKRQRHKKASKRDTI